MNGKWLAERILNGRFRGHETKEMELMRVAPESVLGVGDGGCSQPCGQSEQPRNANLRPKQFLEKYSLPRIVKIAPEEPIAIADCGDPAALLSCTLLLYKQYRSGKIEAKRFLDTRNVKFADCGLPDVASTIVIPDSYQGWFSVMTERGQVKARQYTTVQRLIAAQVTAFLIVGPDLIGYYQNQAKSGGDGAEAGAGARSRYQYVKTTVRTGQILKLLAVYEDIAQQSTRSKRLSWPLLGSKHHSTQYAQCLTVTKQIVYIPITTHGYFYAVSTANNTAEDNVSKVYQIAKLLQVFPLPVRVCSIYPQKINGSILLETYRKEDVMLACVLDDKQSSSSRCRFLEIDINSKFFVHLVADEQRLFKKGRVQRALRNCQLECDKWCHQLKVIHHIYPGKLSEQGQQLQRSYESKESEKAGKRARKLSLGDKKTVKSASFRYSTSYGAEEPKAWPHNLSRTCVTAQPPSYPPVYLDVAQYPNEENCSSLPTQKPDRSVFGKEKLPSAVTPARRYARAAEASESAAADKERPKVTLAELCSKNSHKNRASGSDSGNSNSGSYQRSTSERKMTVTNGDGDISGQSTARVGITKIDDVERLTNCELQRHRQLLLQRHTKRDLRYRLVKRENVASVPQPEGHLSNASGQRQLHVYKTQVVVNAEDAYSDAIDAIGSRRSSGDNVYAEIGEYGRSEVGLAAGYVHVVFPRPKTRFVDETCSSSSYIRLPPSSAVDVS